MVSSGMEDPKPSDGELMEGMEGLGVDENSFPTKPPNDSQTDVEVHPLIHDPPAVELTLIAPEPVDVPQEGMPLFSAPSILSSLFSVIFLFQCLVPPCLNNWNVCACMMS